MSNSPKFGDTNPNSNRRTQANHRHSIEMTTMGLSPYELPFTSTPEAGLDDFSLPSISTVTTSLEFGHQGEMQTNVESSRKGQMSHGFFFGAVSTELLHKLSDNESEKENEKNSRFLIENEEDFLENEDIAGIYSRGDIDRWVRSSQRSFQQSPETFKRDVLSKRIKDVGFIGQNLGLGHITGLCKEDSALIPKKVVLPSSPIHISEQSPVQTDLCWNIPENSTTFSSVVYKVDILLPGQEEWTSLATVRHPVFRTYHTDHKLFLAKQKVDRQDIDLSICLRVCCQGEVTQPDGAKHWTQSPWSKELELIFHGYQNLPTITEQTAL